jgi:D-alanyl-D-alanine carboxypeptidase/D-alanyl-D-alanine-endopeptidase (penicillin-binding protein 4)
VAELRRDLQDILRAPGWDASFGVIVVSLERGDTLFSLNPDLPLAPASNLKLYSTAAALYYLGPRYRFSTLLLADGPIHDGVLHGDLVLYGTGDPTLSGRMLGSAEAPLMAMVDSLVALGVHEVSGDVVGDGSYFDSEWTGPGWAASDLEAWYGAPIGALDWAENLITLRIAPGEPGGPARITTRPETRGLALENRVTTVRNSPTRVRITRARDRLVVEGQVRRGRPATRTLPVVDPANYAAAGLRAVLEAKGVRVRGRVRSVGDPSRSSFPIPSGFRAATPPRIVAAHLSPALADIISVTNHVSHNLFADALLKAAGRTAVGEGSFPAGGSAVRALIGLQSPADTFALHQVDGSGLSHLDRVTARATVGLLDFMRRSDVADAYAASLPEAGNPLGLHRMYDTPAGGNLRAKTGTIHGVSSLSGYVTSADGERLAFSILANRVPSTPREKRSEDAIGARLARFTRE